MSEEAPGAGIFYYFEGCDDLECQTMTTGSGGQGKVLVGKRNEDGKVPMKPGHISTVTGTMTWVDKYTGNIKNFSDAYKYTSDFPRLKSIVDGWSIDTWKHCDQPTPMTVGNQVSDTLNTPTNTGSQEDTEAGGGSSVEGFVPSEDLKKCIPPAGSFAMWPGQPSTKTAMGKLLGVQDPMTLEKCQGLCNKFGPPHGFCKGLNYRETAPDQPDECVLVMNNPTDPNVEIQEDPTNTRQYWKAKDPITALNKIFFELFLSLIS